MKNSLPLCTRIPTNKWIKQNTLEADLQGVGDNRVDTIDIQVIWIKRVWYKNMLVTCATSEDKIALINREKIYNALGGWGDGHWKGGSRKSLTPYLLWCSLMTVSRLEVWACTTVLCSRDVRKQRKPAARSKLSPRKPERTMKVAQDWYIASVLLKNSTKRKTVIKHIHTACCAAFHAALKANGPFMPSAKWNMHNEFFFLLRG